MAKLTASTWLNKKGLTVREFAEKVGFDPAKAEAWFRARVWPSAVELKRIQAVYPDFPRNGGGARNTLPHS